MRWAGIGFLAKQWIYLTLRAKIRISRQGARKMLLGFLD